MRKAKSKKKKRNNPYIGIWIAVIFLFSIFLLVIIMGVQNWVLLAKWDSGGVIEYTGTYTFSEKRYVRNTVYKFELDNGDTIYGQNEYFIPNDVAKSIENENQLTFRYSAYSDIFPSGTFGEHPSISVTLINKDHVIQNEEFMKKEKMVEAIFFTIIGVVCILILSYLLLSYPLMSLKEKVNKYKRCKKKKVQKLKKMQNRNQ